ncbi:MAG TPA: M18 family aminopeptidase [Lentisphaeria bacterium]|nr:MAG: M18 family aminopeptidase [Lentisphaerae bacterium GWF2_38_69]HBM17217.1 M18 family aminopeptidase [Lentisphaeria bacterium]
MSESLIVKNLLDFLSSTPTAYHAVDNVSSILIKNKFEYLPLSSDWKLKPSGKYFTTVNGTTLIAFVNSATGKCKSFRIIGAHTDSPGIKIKPNPEFVKEGFFQLNTEIYGGPILSTWFDRPLSLAGRVFIKGKDAFTPQQKLVNFDKPVAVIPNLAIHMNREINNGYAINNQKDMIPVLISGVDEKIPVKELLENMISEAIKIPKKDILDFELFLYESDGARLAGINDDFVSSSRIDNLEAVSAGLEVLKTAEASADCLKVLAYYDNEEVGSSTKQGADSTLLSSIVERIMESNGVYSPSAVSKAIANSFMISVDGAHSIHPNKTEKYDPINKAQINKGPVLKISANQRYSTDSQSASVLKVLANKAKVPLQIFVNNSNEKGGSTIGPIAGKYLQMPSADLGIPMLAMHSIRELAGTKDHIWMVKLLSAFLA